MMLYFKHMARRLVIDENLNSHWVDENNRLIPEEPEQKVDQIPLTHESSVQQIIDFIETLQPGEHLVFFWR